MILTHASGKGSASSLNILHTAISALEAIDTGFSVWKNVVFEVDQLFNRGEGGKADFVIIMFKHTCQLVGESTKVRQSKLLLSFDYHIRLGIGGCVSFCKEKP